MLPHRDRNFSSSVECFRRCAVVVIPHHNYWQGTNIRRSEDRRQNQTIQTSAGTVADADASAASIETHNSRRRKGKVGTYWVGVTPLH